MPQPEMRPGADSARMAEPTKQTNDWSADLVQPGPVLTREERVREIAEQALDNLAQALEEGRSEALTQFLGTMARFHRYSFGNQLLISMQRPEATLVAGFRTWQSEFGRFVKKGSKGIAIMAPLVRKTKPEETSGEDPGQEAGRKILRGFRVVYVFEVADTDGKPMPEFSRVGGDPGQHLERLKAFIVGQGIELTYEPHLGGAFGLSFGGKISILEGQAPAEEFSVLAHELAHELLHRCPLEERPDKTARETEAEAVAFVVCSGVGLDTGTAAKDYIQLYRGDKDTLAQSLERVAGHLNPRISDLLVESSLLHSCMV